MVVVVVLMSLYRKSLYFLFPKKGTVKRHANLRDYEENVN